MKKEIIKPAEIRERDVLSFNLSSLKIDDCQMSDIGTFCPWDIKYKRDGEWFAANVKVFKHNSYEFFDFSRWNKSWKQNPIDGHPIKRKVIESLMKIKMTETFEDIEVFYGSPNTYTNYYRPTIIFFFADGIALEWNIDELPIPWCPITNSFKTSYFVLAWNPASQEDPTLIEQQFYGLDPLKATRWSWREPITPYKGRNEDYIAQLNQAEYNEKDLH
jgi:hypothetical protein